MRQIELGRDSETDRGVYAGIDGVFMVTDSEIDRRVYMGIDSELDRCGCVGLDSERNRRFRICSHLNPFPRPSQAC